MITPSADSRPAIVGSAPRTPNRMPWVIASSMLRPGVVDTKNTVATNSNQVFRLRHSSSNVASYWLRPYFPVSVAFPTLLALIMKPASAAVAPCGSSSWSTWWACTLKW